MMREPGRGSDRLIGDTSSSHAPLRPLPHPSPRDRAPGSAARRIAVEPAGDGRGACPPRWRTDAGGPAALVVEAARREAELLYMPARDRRRRATPPGRADRQRRSPRLVQSEVDQLPGGRVSGPERDLDPLVSGSSGATPRGRGEAREAPRRAPGADERVARAQPGLARPGGAAGTRQSDRRRTSTASKASSPTRCRRSSPDSATISTASARSSRRRANAGSPSTTIPTRPFSGCGYSAKTRCRRLRGRDRARRG